MFYMYAYAYIYIYIYILIQPLYEKSDRSMRAPGSDVVGKCSLDTDHCTVGSQQIRFYMLFQTFLYYAILY